MSFHEKSAPSTSAIRQRAFHSLPGMRSRHKMKGQFNSLDVLLSILFFVLMLVFMVGFWSESVSAAKNTVKKNQMEYAAIAATDLLVKSAGNQSQNWSQVSMAGFASAPYELSSSKINSFLGMNYTAKKNLRGISNDFYLTVEDTSGSRLYEEGNATASSDLRVTISRFAMLDGQKVILRLTIYGQ